MTALLHVEALHKHFGAGRRRLRAVDGVDIEIGRGESVGLVGESGSGKTTLAMTIAGLERPTSGRVVFDGHDISRSGRQGMRRLRRHIQVVFQDPYASFAPMSTIGVSIAEPLNAHHVGSRASRHARVIELMELVGLRPDHANHYPAEFSGGQLQRAAIARALALSPSLVILDEAVSALDVSTKAQVVNLLADLRERLGLAYLFISHDLATLRYLSDRIAVMYLGRIVESGPAPEVYARPRHPYTQALLSAVPVPNPVVQRSRTRIVLTGDVPSPLAIGDGCRFSSRCPSVMDICRTTDPAPQLVGDTTVACHLHDTRAAQGRSSELPLPA